jgi:restriction system protein
VPIPDYQLLMLPLLRLAQDGNEHRLGDATQHLAKEYGLSESELSELLPSGRQPTFYNRVHWARTYLAQAGLLQLTRRSHFRITDRGHEVLRKQPARINVEFLRQFPEFIDFKTRGRQSKVADQQTPPAQASTLAATKETPDEAIRTTIDSLESALASELLQRILNAPPAFFESLIVTLLLSMGYGGF